MSDQGENMKGRYWITDKGRAALHFAHLRLYIHEASDRLEAHFKAQPFDE